MNLQRYLNNVLADKAVRDEILAASEAGRSFVKAARFGVTAAMIKAVIGPKGEGPAKGEARRPRTEAVVLTTGRPSLLVRNNQFDSPSSVLCGNGCSRGGP